MRARCAVSGLAVVAVVAAVSLVLAGTAWADEDGSDNSKVVDWVGSESNTAYKAKTAAEGANWDFDPTKVSLNQGASASGTNFKGARILDGNGDVMMKGDVVAGVYDDVEHERYAYWEGSTLYFGVKDVVSKNSVDAILEFYWFESSIPRGSDFYVMLLKVKSSPNPWDNWTVIREDNQNILEKIMLFWQDVQPAQNLDVWMAPGGKNGSLRWDFSVPFESYKWEPIKTMQIMRGAVLAQHTGRLDEYVVAVYGHMWEEPKKMDDPDVVSAALAQSGFDGVAILAGIQEQSVKDGLLNNTQASVERGTFGSPTFFVGDEMFFGKDRLEAVKEEIERQK